MNVGPGGPDVWYITRTWLIIGDGLHQGGWLPYDDVGEWVGADGNNVRPVKGRERPYGGNLPSSGQMGNIVPSNELCRRSNSTVCGVLYFVRV